MRERRHVIYRRHHLHIAHAPERDRALAVLRGLLGVRGIENVSVRERSHRLGYAPEATHDLLQRCRFIELAGDEQHRVVRLIVLVVEGLQPLDRNVLDVRARADGRVPVVVPEKGGRHRAFQQNADGSFSPASNSLRTTVISGRAILLRDQAVRHAVRLEPERPAEILGARRHRLEVVRAVEPRRRVRPGAVLVHLRGNVVARGRSLELHVLEQVRHSRLAVAFVPRAHEVGHVDRDGRLGRIREEEHPQPVRQVVLRDPLDGIRPWWHPAAHVRRRSCRARGRG